MGPVTCVFRWAEVLSKHLPALVADIVNVGNGLTWSV